MWNILFYVLVSVCLVSTSAIDDANDDGPFIQNKKVLDKIKAIGEAAKKLMDSEMQEAYHLVLEKIKTKVKASPLNPAQLSAACELLDMITRNLRAGKIRLDHLRYFLSLAQSDKVEKLLATWDQKLLKGT